MVPTQNFRTSPLPKIAPCVAKSYTPRLQQNHTVMFITIQYP